MLRLTCVFLKQLKKHKTLSSVTVCKMAKYVIYSFLLGVFG